MNAAYEALSSPLRQLCDELTAIHDLVSIMGPGIRDRAGIEAFTKFAESTPPVEHPLVRVNPDSGKRCLYVNPLMTARIKNVSPIESQSILNMLFDHITQEEFMIRFSLGKNSVAFWTIVRRSIEALTTSTHSIVSCTVSSSMKKHGRQRVKTLPRIAPHNN